MLEKKQMKLSQAFLCLFFMLLSACYSPPYNNFKPYSRTPKDLIKGGALGTAAGYALGSTLLGTGIGATAFAVHGLSQNSPANTIKALKKQNILYLNHGDRMTLVLPTDKYFNFNSKDFNPLSYSGLYLVLQLLASYPDSLIYVAGFTDEIGSSKHKRWLSQARAETMLTYLWANGIKNTRLHSEGYGQNYTVSSNHFVHGSAQNRRLEIQWYNRPKDKNNCCLTAKLSK